MVFQNNTDTEDIIVNCDCHTHLIRVCSLDEDKTIEPDDRQISLLFYDYHSEPRILFSLKERFRKAFTYLFKGKVSAGEIIITGADAKILAQKLNDLINQNNVK